MMGATGWEFKNRAILFGLIFAVSFSLYSFDPRNSTALLADWLSPRLGVSGGLLARMLFGLAAAVLVLAALLRTWASSYLKASVVYASEVKTARLVADGPYRRVRNPLYFANLLLALGMGAMLSPAGFLVEVILMIVFCYRLILREEAELLANQGEAYRQYQEAVPRLAPSLKPRVALAGGRANWAEGFQAEFWYWGFPVSVASFAFTLNTAAFLVILSLSVALLWVGTRLLPKSGRGARPEDSRR